MALKTKADYKDAKVTLSPLFTETEPASCAVVRARKYSVR